VTPALKIALALLLIGLSGGSARIAQADDATAVRKELQAIANRIDEAYLKKDPDLRAFFDVPAERQASQARHRSAFGQWETVESSRTWVGEVTFRGDEAMAPMTQRMVVARKWQGATYRREYTSAWEQPWMKTHEGWRLKRSVGGTAAWKSLGDAEERFWKSLTGPPVSQAGREAIRGELQALYDARGRTFVKGDVAAAVADLAPEFEVLSAALMITNRAEIAAGLADNLKNGRYEKMVWRIEDLTATDKGVIVHVARSQVYADAGPDGTAQKTSQDLMSLDLWRHEATGWKLVASDGYQASFRAERAGDRAAGEPNHAQAPGQARGPVPAGWLGNSDPAGAYEVTTDRMVKHGGKASGTIRCVAAGADGQAVLLQRFKADEFRGKRVRLRGYVKAANVSDWAGLWMRVEETSAKIVAFDNMQDRPIKGITDWKEYAIVLDVPEHAVSLHFGLLLVGGGQVWVDDLRFDVVGSGAARTDRKLAAPELPDQLEKRRLQEQASLKSTQPENLDFEK
jgi:hypothetical protein